MRVQPVNDLKGGYEVDKMRIVGGLMLLAMVGGALASIGGGGGNLPGRMTGGGSIISNGLRVTHGFTLNCDPTYSPQRLEINWDGNRFHLEQLSTVFCSDNPSIDAGQPYAGFNTYTGSGTGRLNGVSGATIDWVFTDAGEPGTNDFASYTIRDSDGNLILTAAGNLDHGNQQAHKP
jgi:hypothetical protein